jgi:hypothetical protein
MMRLLPPVGWGDVATGRDVQILEDKLTNRIDHAVDSLGQRLDARIDRLEVRLDAMSDAMGGMATRADLADSPRELARTLVTWIFTAQATVVAAVGLLLAYLG